MGRGYPLRFQIGQSPIFGGLPDFCVIFGQVVQTFWHFLGGGSNASYFRGHSIFIFNMSLTISRNA